MRGIDISNWQGGETPSNYDIDFCICKATEGNNFVDDFCDGFIQDCIRNGILWGYYHFAGDNDPREEAKFFWNNTLGYTTCGIPILDYEVWGRNDDVWWCEQFIEAYHDISGVWPMLYISASYCGAFENSWIPETCGLYVAGYPMEYMDWIDREMPYSIYPWSFAAIWQFTSNLWGKFDGNIAYMDADAWMKYAGSKGSTPKPQPKPDAKSVDDYAREVVFGEYGNNEDRKRMLGNKYDEVQSRVNELYAIAEEVIDGKWGNGWNREQALNGAGYPYETVQYIVNEMLA